MVKNLILAAAVAASLQASAQSTPPAPAVTLSWQAVTTMSDGSPIPAGQSVSYNIYGGHSATGPWTLAANITTVSSTRSNVQLGLDCYYITAVVNSVESLPVTPACVTVTAVVSTVPAVPAGFVAVQQ